MIPRILGLLILAATLHAGPQFIAPAGEMPYTRHEPAVKIPVITLLDGREFRECAINRETFLTLSFRHSKGMVKVGKNLLPPDLLAQFPVNEALAEKEALYDVAARNVYAALKKSAEADAKLTAINERLKTEAKLPPAGVVSVMDFALRQTEAGGEYTHYAWTATIANRTGAPQKISHWLRLYDSKKFLLDEAVGDTEIIPAGQTVTVTSKSLVKTELWKQVTSYNCVLK